MNYYIEIYFTIVMGFILGWVFLGRWVHGQKVNRRMYKLAQVVFHPPTIVLLSFVWPFTLIVGTVYYITKVMDDFIKRK